MAIKVLTAEEQAEHVKLYARFVFATALAGKILKEQGIESPAFRKADRAAGEISTKINRILGRTHWMG